jgi:uncharacterized protein YdeI (YjbR/CyaY-like superfamily)
MNSTDTYIQIAPEFSQEILLHFRKLVHQTIPDVEEQIKWKFPHFIYKKEVICSMAAFSKHCAFSFPKAALMKDKTLLEKAKTEEAMGHFGKIKTLQDLPSDSKIKAYIKDSVSLIGKKREMKIISVGLPKILKILLDNNKNANDCFLKMSPSHQKEYINYINEAKKIETQMRRAEKVLEMILNKSIQK